MKRPTVLGMLTAGLLMLAAPAAMAGGWAKRVLPDRPSSQVQRTAVVRTGVALPSERFASLFDRSDAELQILGIRRTLVDTKPGYPCRVSLMDAEIGESVLLIPYTHHDVSSPYRASGPIFVRAGARTSASRSPARIPRRS